MRHSLPREFVHELETRIEKNVEWEFATVRNDELTNGSTDKSTYQLPLRHKTTSIKGPFEPNKPSPLEQIQQNPNMVATRSST
jgi:hypothetical protein